MAEEELDIYRRGDLVHNKIAKIKADPDLTKRNREKILEFHRWIVAQGLGSERQHKYLQSLQNIGHWLGKDFEKATGKDIIRVLADHVENNGYKEWTKVNYRQVLKKFYRWLIPYHSHPLTKGGGEERKKCAKCYIDQNVKASEPKENTQRRWVLITEDDVKKMIEKANNPRDAALLAMMWESGARISEIMGVQIRHILLLEEGAITVSFEGKTGVRSVKLWTAAPYIRDWLRQHPYSKQPQATLWPSRERKDGATPVSYTIVVKIIGRSAERAGIKGKDLNPHAWRHARATFLANKGWSEQQLDKFLGWKFGSNMPRIYIDRAGVDVEGAVDSLYGILPKEEEVPKDKPQRCVRCRELVAPTMTFCPKCGLPMTQESAQNLEEARQTSQGIMEERLKRLERLVGERKPR